MTRRLNPENWLAPDSLRYGGTDSMLRAFGDTFAALNLAPSDFQGDLLFAGVGPLFPERVFFADPKSKYKKMRKGVSSFVAVDMDYLSSPEDYIFPGVDRYSLPNYAPGEGEVLNINSANAFICGSFWGVLEQVERMYDTITFCRVPNLPDQIADDGLALIANRLKPGGKAILSGPERCLYNKLSDQAEQARKKLGVSARVENLYAVADLFNYMGESGHAALVLEKNR
jgi:hypothetical protein